VKCSRSTRSRTRNETVSFLYWQGCRDSLNKPLNAKNNERTNESNVDQRNVFDTAATLCSLF